MRVRGTSRTSDILRRYNAAFASPDDLLPLAPSPPVANLNAEYVQGTNNTANTADLLRAYPVDWSMSTSHSPYFGYPSSGSETDPSRSSTSSRIGTASDSLFNTFVDNTSTDTSSIHSVASGSLDGEGENSAKAERDDIKNGQTERDDIKNGQMDVEDAEDPNSPPDAPESTVEEIVWSGIGSSTGIREISAALLEATAFARHIDEGRCTSRASVSPSHAPVFDLGSEWVRVTPPCMAPGRVLSVAASQTNVIDGYQLSKFIRSVKDLFGENHGLFTSFIGVLRSWVFADLSYERLIGWLSFFFATVPDLLSQANILLVKSDRITSELLVPSDNPSESQSDLSRTASKSWKVTFESPFGAFAKVVTF